MNFYHELLFYWILLLKVGLCMYLYYTSQTDFFMYSTLYTIKYVQYNTNNIKVYIHNKTHSGLKIDIDNNALSILKSQCIII